MLDWSLVFCNAQLMCWLLLLRHCFGGFAPRSFGCLVSRFVRSFIQGTAHLLPSLLASLFAFFIASLIRRSFVCFHFGCLDFCLACWMVACLIGSCVAC